MCGAGAMRVTCVCGVELEGCDAGESELCRDFATTLVSSCAGVIFGIKPVALFSYRPQAAVGVWEGRELRAKLRELVRTYRGELAAFGVGLVPVHEVSGRMMLIAYREDLVERILANEDDRAFLDGAGYDTSSVPSLISEVRRRLVVYYESATADDGRAPHPRHRVRQAAGTGGRAGFPHEMGILFGYPLRDVLGFINGESPTCRGSWIAYGDEDESRHRFALVSRVEGECKGRFRRGETLRELLERGTWSRTPVRGRA